MAIGPVQLIVLGFKHPDFHGEIIAELERLRESDTVRVIDALAVYKDANGEIEVEHLSNLTQDEAIELGSKVGALIGLGIEGEEGAAAGAVAGAEAAADGVAGLRRRGGMGRHRGHPERLRGRAGPDRAPLGGAAARRDRAGRRLPDQRRLHQPARPGRDRPDDRRGSRELHALETAGHRRTLTHEGGTTCSDHAEWPGVPAGAPPAGSADAADQPPLTGRALTGWPGPAVAGGGCHPGCAFPAGGWSEAELFMDMAPSPAAATPGLARSDPHGPGITRVRGQAGLRVPRPVRRRDHRGRDAGPDPRAGASRRLDRVWISPDPLGHIQATGVDSRGRTQYRYHQLWREQRDAQKFGHMLRFADRAARAARPPPLARPAAPRPGPRPGGRRARSG